MVDRPLIYSSLKDFTGLAIAAFIDWKLTVKSATSKAPKNVIRKTPIVKPVR